MACHPDLWPPAWLAPAVTLASNPRPWLAPMAPGRSQGSVAALPKRLVWMAAPPGFLSPTPPFSSMEPSTTSPALSVAITVLVVLLALTGFGIYTAFGPPSKRLSDPFDDHDD